MGTSGHQPRCSSAMVDLGNIHIIISTLTRFIILFSSLLSNSFSTGLTDDEASFIARRQLLTFGRLHDVIPKLPYLFEIEPKGDGKFGNERLERAYVALQALKNSVHSDPSNFTGNWVGRDVCDYNGVFCAPALDDPNLTVVAGIDLNGADIAAFFPQELGLMTDLALLHINSNRFCGTVPESFRNLSLMHEFDISNNRFVGACPFATILSWPEIKYLDIRFNNFEGELPPELFLRKLDALFLNDNWFTGNIPETIGNSTVSVITFSNNHFQGCIPRHVGNMVNLKEINFRGNKLGGCLPLEMASLGNVTVLDLSSNSFTGVLPNFLANLRGLESVDVRDNKLTGFVPEGLCRLEISFMFSHNYFNGEGNGCIMNLRKDIIELDDRENCLPDRPKQRSSKECRAIINKPVDCSKHKCSSFSSSSPPTPKPVVQSLPPPPQSPPPPPPPQYSPPLLHSPPPPVQRPVHSLVQYSPPPPPLPPMQPQFSSPPSPIDSVLPPPTDIDHDFLILPPDVGYNYNAPPPPLFPGY